MRKSFSARMWGSCCITLFTLFAFNSTLLSQCASGTLSGQIYTDVNNNGQIDVGESGFASFQVRAYDTDGNWVSQAVSDASGQFTITNLDDGENYRLQYAVSSA